MPGTSQTADDRMERRLGLPAVTAICLGALFSSGFFLLPGFAVDEAGTAVWLAYLVAGVLVLPALLSIAELSSAMPRAGGPYYFLHRSFGPLAGILAAFGNYAQLVFKGAFAFVGVGAYLSLVVDLPARPVALALIALFTVVNLLGTSQTARAEIMLVAALLVLLSWFVVGGGVELAREPATLGEVSTPLLPTGLTGLFGAIALVFVSYAGIGQVASLSEEVRDPARTLPRGMLLALGVATVFYAAGTAIMAALVPTEQLADDPVPVASTVTSFVTVPLPVVAVVVGALAAFASTGNAAILAAARYPLAMARDDLLWGRFARIDRKGVPRLAVLVTSAVIAGAVLLLDVEAIARAASAFLLLVFAAVCAAVLVFRASRAEHYRPGFRSPLHPWVQSAGLVVYPVLILGSGPLGAGLVVALLLLGGAWYAVLRRRGLVQSAAIHQLFARLAETSGRPSESHTSWLLRRSGHPLDELVGRAMVLDDAEVEDLDDLARQAANALADRVGGQRDRLSAALVERVRPWASPDEYGIVVSPVPMEGIEQPEMVLARVPDGLPVDGHRATGFVFLIDDASHAGRLLELVSQLTMILHRRITQRAWRAAAGPDELRAALAQDVRTVTVVMDDDTPALGQRLDDLDLPEGSLVVLIRRDGAAMVPHGGHRLCERDEVTLLVEPDVAEEVQSRF